MARTDRSIEEMRIIKNALRIKDLESTDFERHAEQARARYMETREKPDNMTEAEKKLDDFRAEQAWKRFVKSMER